MTVELQSALHAGVMVLGIDRPQSRNALTPQLLGMILDALAEAAQSPDIRVVILRGAGSLPFSSGYDLGQVGLQAVTSVTARGLQKPIRDVASAIVALRKPVIGAVQGFAYGAAMDVLAHCDLRVAAHGARFSLPPARLGFSYPAEGIDRLAAVLGLSRATELALLADPVADETMLQWGFLHRSWPAAGFEDRLAAFAAQLATRAPMSLAALKTIISGLSGQPGGALVEAGYASLAACLNSTDASEGMAASRERRLPRFRGE